MRTRFENGSHPDEGRRGAKKRNSTQNPSVASRLLPRYPGEVLRDDPRYIVLKELGTNQGPIGCWRIRSALQAAGIVASEATVGRLLRFLDMQELTQAIGSKGRILTAKGLRHLAALELALRRQSYHSDLHQAVCAETVEDVLDLLAARRAVEAETARLAALRATKQEIRQIEHAVHRHIQEMRDGSLNLDHNRGIHRLIAQASGSRILHAVVNILLQEEYLQEIQDRIQRATGGMMPADHLVVLQAIKDRQPDEAAEAMRAHIDRLLRVIESYSAESRKKGGAKASSQSTDTHVGDPEVD
jgi:GntR family L-lactate dehydrogenase operon transcriptional regulator